MIRPAGWASVGMAAIFLFAESVFAQSLPPYQGGPQPLVQNRPQTAQPLPAPAQEGQVLTPQQLEDLVAPIALYPDPLLGQVLAASTYPLEIVDAEQWMQQHKGMPAAQLVDAAKQQSWDPSVQALVAFPDVLDILGHDIRWTTDLGNAFLAQQADVMRAVQTLRARAQQSGALQSTPQQAVTTQYQDGQSAVQIQPTDPQVVYVPVYQPYAVWGPPVYGAYPNLWYPPAWSFGVGISFSPGIFLGSLFAGLLSFGPWGWGLNWFAHALFCIPSFFAHFFGGWGHGYGYGGYGLAARQAWVHDPVHRMGVPYANRAVATRFGGRFAEGGRVERSRTGGGFAANRGVARAEAPRSEAPRTQAGGAWRGVGSGAGRGYSGERGYGGNSFAARTAPQGNSFRGESSFNQNQGRAFSQPQGRAFSQSTGRSFSQSRRASQPRGSESMGRSFAQSRAPAQQHYSAPRSSAHMSSGGGGSSHASVSHGSGGHSSAGHGGGHSGGHRG